MISLLNHTHFSLDIQDLKINKEVSLRGRPQKKAAPRFAATFPDLTTTTALIW